MDKKIKIGKVWVDSGHVIIGDPIYTENMKYDKLLKNPKAFKKQHFQIKNNLAVVSSSGLGDGEYPVFATVGKMGRFGTRVKSITIVFDTAKERKMANAMLKKVM
jgi:hypothetical protein